MNVSECVLPIELILHPDYQDFVKTCRLNLADAAPFLVWADWLEEYGIKHDLPGPQIKAIVMRNSCLRGGSYDYEYVQQIREISHRYCKHEYDMSAHAFDLIASGFDIVLYNKPTQFNNIIWPTYFNKRNYLRIYSGVKLDKIRLHPVQHQRIGKILAAHPHRYFYRENFVNVFYYTPSCLVDFKLIGCRFRDFVQRHREESLQKPLLTRDGQFFVFEDQASFEYVRDIAFRDYMWMLADEWVAAQQKLRGMT